MLLVAVAGVLAIILPTLHSTAEVVFTAVMVVVVAAFIVSIWVRGGGGGGWRSGPMGN